MITRITYLGGSFRGKINSNNDLRMGRCLGNSVCRGQKFKGIHPAGVGWYWGLRVDMALSLWGSISDERF